MTRVQSSCLITNSLPTEVHVHSMFANCIANMATFLASQQVVLIDEEFVDSNDEELREKFAVAAEKAEKFRETLHTAMEKAFANIQEDAKQRLVNTLVASKITDEELSQYVKVIGMPAYCLVQDIFKNHLDAIAIIAMAYFNKLLEETKEYFVK